MLYWKVVPISAAIEITWRDHRHHHDAVHTRIALLVCWLDLQESVQEWAATRAAWKSPNNRIQPMGFIASSSNHTPLSHMSKLNNMNKSKVL
jgi:hypothetical protein